MISLQQMNVPHFDNPAYSLDGVKRAVVVNCSTRFYNLGAHKLVDWLRSQGVEATYAPEDPEMFVHAFDLVCLSVIFSHHAVAAAAIANRAKHSAQVWCGGPGVLKLGTWWKNQTGLDRHAGIDWRFERQRGSYLSTFASRGCPVGCSFCIVPQLEGLEFTLDWDFLPAPVLCDNNLSALPVDFQEHIIRRYQESGVTLKDANSGFEPRTFDAGTYARWKPILRGPWRFAFDETAEECFVEPMAAILANESPKRKQVYVLIGTEPIEACYRRCVKVIEWGCEPFCQYIRPLTWLGGKLPTPYDWTEQLGKDFCRYFNRRLWRAVPIEDYNDRQEEDPPFRGKLKGLGRTAV